MVLTEPLTMQTPYSKPKTFSDPYHDWYGYETVFQDILAQNPDDLSRSDFGMIFAPILPAADYEEGVYYLDACFRRMSRMESAVESNLCGGVFWFIDRHRERLGADGLLAPCLGLVSDLWRTYTEDFALVRFTDAELREYGIREDWREFVKHSRTVHDLADAMVEHETFRPTLDDLLGSLADGGVVGSCWWVEIAYHARWWYVIHRPGREENERQQAILHRLLDLETYPEHERQARDYARGLGFGEYHRRVSIV